MTTRTRSPRSVGRTFAVTFSGILLLFSGCTSKPPGPEETPETHNRTPPDAEAPAPEEAVKPLSLEGFLDETLPEAPKEETKLLVDNDACYVCHGNYKEEELVITHGMARVGCADCHGDSFDHRNDEDNITPPDTMYALADVDAMCSECHEEHDVPPALVVKRWHERCPETTAPACTDCHFAHRLKLRTVRWDKKTGALLPRSD